MLKNKNWVEVLPEKCPPEGSFEPTGQIFYRIINADSLPLCDDHFRPTELRYSTQRFPVPECIQKAVSIWNNLQAMERICKLGDWQVKKPFSLTLPKGSGLIKQTGRHLEHFSWWRISEFEPVKHTNAVPS